MRNINRYLVVVVAILFANLSVLGQSTEFVYQGSLQNGGTAATGNFDFEFLLFDALTGGSQFGSTLTKSSVAVANGIFSVRLDFGSQFPGANRYLEVHVRPAGVGSFTPLAPRQPVGSSPYSVQSLNAANAANAANATTATTATNATQLGGVAANQYVLTGDTRLSDARNPLPGSSSYIQNQNASPQTSSNFNISGDGTAGGTLSGNHVVAASSFDLSPGGPVLYVRRNANNPSGPISNIFAGVIAGVPAPQGEDNSAFGYESAIALTQGTGNSFFGSRTGLANNIGVANSFFGNGSGISSVDGNFNSFVGAGAGSGNTNGSNSSFFGISSGSFNTIGGRNTALGAYANFGANNLSNATAIGADSLVSQNNSIVLGSISGINGAAADTNVGIGTTAPTERLHVVGNGLFTGNLTVNGQLNGTVTNATTATNALQLGGIAASGYLQTNGNGSGLTNLNAANISSGTLSNARLGLIPTANIADSAVTSQKIASGQVVKGVTVGASSLTDTVTLSAGTNITLTPAGNTVTIAATGGAGGVGGSGTTNTLPLWSGGSTLGNSAITQSGNKVGIGTNTPNTDLHLRSGSTTGFAIQMENTSTAKRLYIGNYGTTGAGNHWPGMDSANTSFLYAENPLIFTTPGGIYFSGSTTAEHMRIATNGNVGIGTTSPSSKFTLNSTTPNAFAATLQTSGIATGSSYGVVINAGTDVTDSALQVNSQSGTPFMRVRGNGSVGIGTTNPLYRLHVVEPTSGAFGGYIAADYGLRLDGTHVGLLATSVTSSLQVGAGVSVSGGFSTDSFSASGAASITGDAVFNGHLTINNQPTGGVPLCYAYSSNFVTQCASSRRFKKNIDDFNRGLDLVRVLRPVTFDWKSDDRRDIGLIAEEVEAAEPLLTTHLNDGQIQGVRYDLIGVVLINAVKEQQRIIESQQKQNDELKKQVDELRAVVCSIKAGAEICRK